MSQDRMTLFEAMKFDKKTMIKIITFTFLLATFITININAKPYLVFPEKMLPPIGLTYNITFTGFAVTTPVAGVYSIQAVTAKDREIIIGYRLWEEYVCRTRNRRTEVRYKNDCSSRCF